MPFHRLKSHDIELFHCLNPDPKDFTTASVPDDLPSRPFKPELPTIVLVHASSSSVLEWVRQFTDPRLYGRFNLFAMDCALCGWTKVSSAAGAISLEASADFVVELLDEMAFPDYHLLGEAVHGCNIASWIASKRPERVKSLTLASPGFRVEDPEVCASLEEIRKVLLVNKPGNGGDDSGTLPEEPLAEICAYFIGALPRLKSARQAMSDRFQKRYGTNHPLYEVDTAYDLVTERKAIPDGALAFARPVMILRGGDDNIVSPERACEEWTRAFANAQVSSHVIAPAPSLLSLSDANVVNRIVSSFCLRSQ
ncbi:hypothetical protein JCM3766R1_004252 [Sporobolomyces carnicolor]